MRLDRTCLTVLFVLASSALSAETSRPKIGLALSGGGAKGYAHIGALKVLEEMRVPVDYVAWTSMGAVVGALYASGMSPEEIEREVAIIDWAEALTDATDYRELSYRRKEDIVRYPSTTWERSSRPAARLPLWTRPSTISSSRWPASRLSIPITARSTSERRKPSLPTGSAT